MRRTALAALTVVGLLLAACSDDDGSGSTTAAPTSTTASTEPSTTETTETTDPADRTGRTDPSDTAAGPGATSSTTTAATPAPSCSGGGLPTAATAVSEASADVDGDGRPDVLRSYVIDGTWSLQVELAAGGAAALELPDSHTGGIGVIGGADVDGDGRAEVWARVGSGASTAILGMARLEGCDLVRVVTDFGTPVELPVGGSVGAAGGVDCQAGDTGADLTVFSVVYVDEDHYEVTATEHVLDGATLHPRGTTAATVRFDDPILGRATTFTCHDLML